MPANAVDEWARCGSVPEFLVIYLFLSSKNHATRSKHNERELTNDEKQRFQNNVRANFSVYERMPHFLKMFSYTLAYAGPIRYSVTGP